jgi:hypothetical protein
MAKRLGLIIHKIISNTQTAFINDRFIMEGIVVVGTTHWVPAIGI